MSGLLLAFVLVDGLVSRNPQPWTAPVRAGLVAVLFLVGVALLWRARVHVEPGAAFVIGVLAALVVSDVYRAPTGLTLSTWIVYAGAYALQRAIKRSWTRDLAITGVALAALVFVVALTKLPPDGAWNRNVTGGILLATLAASTQLGGRWRIVAPGLILAGIAATTSRGAIVGAFVTLAVIVQPWALLAAPVAAVALVFIRPYEASVRLLFWQQGIDAIISSPIFGVGVGRLIVAGDGKMGPGIHVHNALLGIAAQVGIVGVAVASATAAIARRVAMQRWQLAMLAGIASHSMVDDPLCWLPVGVILTLVMASQNGVSNQRQSVA